MYFFKLWWESKNTIKFYTIFFFQLSLITVVKNLMRLAIRFLGMLALLCYIYILALLYCQRIRSRVLSSFGEQGCNTT
jgi:hypothetical protein